MTRNDILEYKKINTAQMQQQICCYFMAPMTLMVTTMLLWLSLKMRRHLVE